MRKLIAAAALVIGTLLAAPAQGADLTYYPELIEIPDVDYGLSGSFYLRGSVAGGLMRARNVEYVNCGCGAGPFDIDEYGYGYSLGAGVGYEFGNGFRTDLTVDYLANSGMTDSNGYSVDMRSGLALANVYYDFGFNGQGSAAGGFGAYVGAGVGAMYNSVTADGPGPVAPDGGSVEAAAALMAGLTYDMGSVVADLGYRGIYLDKITNQDAVSPYFVNNNFIHELRGTVRYRFN